MYARFPIDPLLFYVFLTNFRLRTNNHMIRGSGLLQSSACFAVVGEKQTSFFKSRPRSTYRVELTNPKPKCILSWKTLRTEKSHYLDIKGKDTDGRSLSKGKTLSYVNVCRDCKRKFLIINKKVWET